MSDATSQSSSLGPDPFQAASAAMAMAPSLAPPDFIDLDDPACVRRWTAKFGVTEEELRIAVRVAGPHICAVAAHFNLE